MSIFEETMSFIREGIAGKNLGIPFKNCPGLTESIYGIRRGIYVLIGAETGVGKTKFARDQFMFGPYDYYKMVNDVNKLDIKFLDFSLEITTTENMINAIIRKIYIDDKRVFPYKKVAGIIAGYHPNPEELALMNSKKIYFEDYEKKLTVVGGEVTPTKFHDTLLNHFRKNGKFSNDTGALAISKLGTYTPNNPQLMTIALVDTINLVDTEGGQVNKQSIDRISKIALNFRNICNATPIIIQQFNSDNSEIQRQRYGSKTPMLRDFEDSKRTTKDADIVIGLWDPMKYNEKTMKFGTDVLDVTILRSWLKSAHLLKNRHGVTNRRFPLRFLGAVSMFEEFPPSMTPMDYTRLTRL